MEHLTDIDPIVTKYLREEVLSPEEQAALDLWISKGEGRSQMLEDLKNDTDSIKAKLMRMEQVSNTRIWDTIVSKVQQDGYWQEPEAAPVPTLPVNRPAARIWARYVMAACVILILAGGAWWLYHQKPVTPAVAAHPATTPAPDVAPGGNRATLTLADGRQINLDSSASGVLASQGNMQVSKLSGGQLAYNKITEEKPQTPSFNVLTTPRAGQFSLALPDGSHVWLNNASSIRYPIAFTGATREVELSGEAYFEVAKDAAHPFFVHTTGSPAGPASIEVLGTSFNIMAYNDENAERATLVDGSIRYLHGNDQTLLKPEEQSVLDANGSLKTLKEVNIAEITAWKNGYFHFDHASLETTMRQIARWYDISVNYEGSVPAQQFVGKIQRNMPLSSLLKNLSNDHIHFKLEGRNLTVMP
jgi:ferric-dicitrate binding protein FerR (iron transport regulator)